MLAAARLEIPTDGADALNDVAELGCDAEERLVFIAPDEEANVISRPFFDWLHVVFNLTYKSTMKNGVN